PACERSEPRRRGRRRPRPPTRKRPASPRVPAAWTDSPAQARPSQGRAAYPQAVPFYVRLGDVPRKRHIQHRENGTLLTQEVMGLEGFSGNESILYHVTSPCRIKELGSFEPIEREEWEPPAHAHRHF